MSLSVHIVAFCPAFILLRSAGNSTDHPAGEHTERLLTSAAGENTTLLPNAEVVTSDPAAQEPNPHVDPLTGDHMSPPRTQASDSPTGTAISVALYCVCP